MADCLAFESSKSAVMNRLDVETLRNLFAAGGSGAGSGLVQFVFVSACHSQGAGEAFVQAGVPHVVAVRTLETVSDKAAEK